VQELDAGRAGAIHARDQLIAEAPDPLLGVRRPLPEADVQCLARVGPGREERVVAQQPGVAVAGALLVVAADLAEDAATSINSLPVVRARAGLPGALDRLPEQLVELVHMPERERP